MKQPWMNKMATRELGWLDREQKSSRGRMKAMQTPRTENIQATARPLRAILMTCNNYTPKELMDQLKRSIR